MLVALLRGEVMQLLHYEDEPIPELADDEWESEEEDRVEEEEEEDDDDEEEARKKEQ